MNLSINLNNKRRCETLIKCNAGLQFSVTMQIISLSLLQMLQSTDHEIVLRMFTRSLYYIIRYIYGISWYNGNIVKVCSYLTYK